MLVKKKILVISGLTGLTRVLQLAERNSLSSPNLFRQELRLFEISISKELFSESLEKKTWNWE